MRMLFVGALLVVASMAAGAADVRINCTGPTQWDTGEPIAPGTVIDYRLWGGFTGATKTVLDTKPACAFTRTNVAPGTAEYYVTAVVAGAESDPSATKTVVVPPLPPDPPVTLITAGPYSYALTGTASAPTMSAIGLVVGGLPCGPAKMIGAFKFCQITRAQTDLIGWPVDKTLASGLWARAQ